MNYFAKSEQPYLALVDDDSHSARLLTRMLLAHGAPSVRWMEGADVAESALGAPDAELPGMVIVDLKSSSAATRDFITRLKSLPNGHNLVVAAMAPTLARDIRDGLIDAGAAAVFERHPDVDAYRREAASIVSYWVRHQRLNAIGT